MKARTILTPDLGDEAWELPDQKIIGYGTLSMRWRRRHDPPDPPAFGRAVVVHRKARCNQHYERASDVLPPPTASCAPGATRRLSLAPHPIIAIFGAPASGKTYWRTRIAQHLDWSSINIEDYGEPGSGRWTRLIDQLQADDSPVIVESIACPKPYRATLRRCPSFVIHVSAPRSTRWARLKEREPTTARARELFAIAGRPPRRPDISIHSRTAEQWLIGQCEMRAQRLVCKTGRDTPHLAC